MWGRLWSHRYVCCVVLVTHGLSRLWSHLFRPRHQPIMALQHHDPTSRTCVVYPGVIVAGDSTGALFILRLVDVVRMAEARRLEVSALPDPAVYLIPAVLPGPCVCCISP